RADIVHTRESDLAGPLTTYLASDPRRRRGRNVRGSWLEHERFHRWRLLGRRDLGNDPGPHDHEQTRERERYTDLGGATSLAVRDRADRCAKHDQPESRTNPDFPARRRTAHELQQRDCDRDPLECCPHHPHVCSARRGRSEVPSAASQWRKSSVQRAFSPHVQNPELGAVSRHARAQTLFTHAKPTSHVSSPHVWRTIAGSGEGRGRTGGGATAGRTKVPCSSGASAPTMMVPARTSRPPIANDAPTRSVPSPVSPLG